MISDLIRIVVVDDSPLASLALTGLLQSDPQICVVGVARDGREALEMVPRLKPDLVTMDVWMPHVDGFAAVEQLMARHPLPILVITSSLTRRDVDISLTMLNAGALDVFEKPTRRDEVAWERARRQLIQRVKVLARVPVRGPAGRRATGPLSGAALDTRAARPPAGPPAGASGSPAPRPTPGALPAHAWAGGPVSAPVDRAALPLHGRAAAGHRYALAAIVASTGGPQALLTILLNLPAGFTTPVLIVQHIAAGFTQGLADWLGRESGRTVRPAVAGERPVPGAALLAPDGAHMALAPNGTITLPAGGPHEIRPSADVLLFSLAAVLGNRAVGVILTGMGRDGAEGLRAMRLAGAYTIAQDEASSVIFGMPQAAIALGTIDEVLPLTGIAPRLGALIGS